MEAAVQQLLEQNRELVSRIQSLEAQIAETAAAASAASSTAQAAAAVTTAAASATTRESRTVLDTRLPNKLEVFHGINEKWSDWSFDFIAHCAALSGKLEELMRQASQADEPIEVKSEADKELSRQLYYLLVQLTAGKAKQKVKKVTPGNGFEAWRQFHSEWEPRQRARFTSMLYAIMRTEITDPILPALDKLEQDIKKYQDQSGNIVPDDVIASTVTGGMQNEAIAQHLEPVSYTHLTLPTKRIV